MEEKARSLCKLNLVAQKRVVMKTWDEVLFDERKKLGLKIADHSLCRSLVRQVILSVEDERL